MNIPDYELRKELESRLDAATSRLSTLESEVTRLKSHIRGLREVLNTLNAAIHESNLIDATIPQAELPPLADHTIKDAARQILVEVKTPMLTRDLLNALTHRGKRVGGKEPVETLRAVLTSYDEVFKKTPDAKWTLAVPQVLNLDAVVRKALFEEEQTHEEKRRTG